MAEFIAFDLNVEVSGQATGVILAAMGPFQERGRELLADAGIAELSPEFWYPQQHLLDALRQISEKIGKNLLYFIGSKIPDHAVFPSGITTLDQALSSLDTAYHMNHRGGEIGNYRYQPISDRSALMVCENPYPCDFDRGLLTGLCLKSSPPELIIEVTHGEHHSCRKRGDQTCTYEILW